MSGNMGGWARRRYAPCLASAAQAVLDLYRRWAGRADAVAAEIERRLDGCAAAPGGARDALVPLLRMRDVQRYVEDEPDLQALKLALLDAALVRREPARRWQAARDLLARELPRIVDAPLEELGEAFKRELSGTGSRLGRLLRLCALLNLEAAGEMPPPNATLRFARGRFPEHAWESPQGDGAWQPVVPLGRWEYLAADLAERVYRARRADRDGEESLGAAPADGAAARYGSATQYGSAAQHCPAGKEGPAERVYCRMDPREPLAQLPLLPVDADRLLPELLRHLHGRLGGEGVRQAVLVFAACAGADPGAAVVLDRSQLHAACGDATRREARERSRKLNAALALLGAVAIQRVGPDEQGQRVRTTRLVTVLGWDAPRCAAGGAPAPGCGAEDDGVPAGWERLTILADPVLWDGQGRPLGASLRQLPAQALALSPREHPHALAAAAWLARHFAARPGVPVRRCAPALMQEMGLADGPRAEASFRRDLQRLRELGAIGRWRQVRAQNGSSELWIEPPGLAGGVRPGTAARAGARLARRRVKGGGSDWAVS